MQRYASNRSSVQSCSREEKRHQRELQKQLKEQAKFNQLEQARLEVAEHESRFGVLLSLHKDSAPLVNWNALVCVLKPPAPGSRIEKEDRHLWRLDRIADPEILPDTEPPLLKEEDEVSRHEHKEYIQAVADWSKTRSLAQRVLSGEETAYLEALSEFSFLDELTLLGAEIEVGLHTLRKIEVTFRANDEAVIPGEIKSLTSTGKVSNKAVPRVRFREIYQDHVCSSMLRVAREMFAVLPIEELILNTRAQVFDSATGIHTIAAIYSVRIPREGLVGLNYESLDPSDAIERFNHAGDFSASRRSGAFQGVTPLTFEEQEFDSSDLDVLARKAKDVRLALLESVGANSA